MSWEKGCVIPESVFNGTLATKVCHPLKHKCRGARKVEYILLDEDGPKIVTMLLLLSGDVETNPGPGTIFFFKCNRTMGSIGA